MPVAKTAKAKRRAPKSKPAAAAPLTRADPGVAALMRGLDHPMKRAIAALRDIVLAADPGIGEGVKWNAPSFRTAREYFATINLRRTDSVQLVLHLGAKTRPDLDAIGVADPNGLLKWLAKDRALVTLGSAADVAANRAALTAIVRAWIEYV